MRVRLGESNSAWTATYSTSSGHIAIIRGPLERPHLAKFPAPKLPLNLGTLAQETALTS
ncbi:hypothetical protein [Streptomyces sp. NPDC002889]|uniref:hypothetical protein n=1 Tax=Streptomyces sp. NPDC002889 TaxID=3364669 RepID=UPI00368F3352